MMFERQLITKDNPNFLPVTRATRERSYGATGLTASKRKANLAKIAKNKEIQDLYARESKKRSAMSGVGGKESPEYKKRMHKLKLMAEGRRIPLEMKDISGS